MTAISYIVLIPVVWFVALLTEADYTLDDSFWNDESPVGMSIKMHNILVDRIWKYQ